MWAEQSKNNKQKVSELACLVGKKKRSMYKYFACVKWSISAIRTKNKNKTNHVIFLLILLKGHTNPLNFFELKQMTSEFVPGHAFGMLTPTGRYTWKPEIRALSRDQ